MADLIVVVDGGRIVEFGTHEELLANNKGYAEMFEMQARAYRR
jgi:ATP-binding cassette subfamily B protein